MGEACYILRHIFDGIGQPLSYFKNNLGMSAFDFVEISILLSILALYDYFDMRDNSLEILNKKNVVVRWCVYIIIGLMTVFLSQKGEVAEFVYFQF